MQIDCLSNKLHLVRLIFLPNILDQAVVETRPGTLQYNPSNQISFKMFVRVLVP